MNNIAEKQLEVVIDKPKQIRKPNVTATIERLRLLSYEEKVELRDALEDMIDSDKAAKIKELEDELKRMKGEK